MIWLLIAFAPLILAGMVLYYLLSGRIPCRCQGSCRCQGCRLARKAGEKEKL